MDTDTMTKKHTGLPRDTHGSTVQLVPNKPAVARFNGTCAASTTVAVNADASFIEINALDDGIFLKYGSTAVTNANFDEFIHAGATRHYSIPKDITTLRIIDNGGGGRAIIIQK